MAATTTLRRPRRSSEVRAGPGPIAPPDAMLDG
jgi:hypothetical protein